MNEKEKYKKISSYEEAVEQLSAKELENIFGADGGKSLTMARPARDFNWSRKWDFCSNGCPTHCMGWSNYPY